MNLFLGVALPETAVKQILTQTEALRRDYPEYNWVPPQNFHVSLYHIGEVPDLKVPLVVEHVEKSLFDITESEAYGLGADLFITSDQIILYLTFQRNKTLEKLHNTFKDLFEDQTKKEYLPHITIARYKIPSKQQYFLLQKKLSHLDVELDFPIHHIQLFQSISRSKNPLYNKVKTFSLQQKD